MDYEGESSEAGTLSGADREEQTILHYRQKAFDVVQRYESVDVSDLQMRLRDSLNYRAKVLELGCGSGRDAAFLKRFSNIREITATDACPEMLRHAERIHPDLAGKLLELRLPHGLLDLLRKGESYNGIFSIAAVMHLSQENIRETLQHIELLLQPGGVLFLSVCTTRDEQPDSDPRLFTLKPADWWQNQIERVGLKTAEINISDDSLGRVQTKWLSITAVK